MAKPEHVDGDNKKIVFLNDVKLHILKVAFDKNYKWAFYYNGQKTHAKIADRKFIKNVEKGEKFSKGDVLIADLEIQKIFNESLNTYIDHSHIILRVKSHIPSPQEKDLFE